MLRREQGCPAGWEGRYWDKKLREMVPQDPWLWLKEPGNYIQAPIKEYYQAHEVWSVKGSSNTLPAVHISRAEFRGLIPSYKKPYPKIKRKTKPLGILLIKRYFRASTNSRSLQIPCTLWATTSFILNPMLSNKNSDVKVELLAWISQFCSCYVYI